MFEAKYNLWKLGNKLHNNVSPHYFIFFQKEKKYHFLKIDNATNTCQTLSVPVLKNTKHEVYNILNSTTNPQYALNTSVSISTS